MRCRGARGFNELLVGQIGALHGSDAGIGIHRRKFDCGICLLGVGVYLLNHGDAILFELGIVVLPHGQDLYDLLDAIELFDEFSAHCFDLGIFHRAHQRHGAVHTGMHLSQLLVGR